MSRLHDMKTGIVSAKKVAVKNVENAMFKFSGKFVNTLTTLNKQDPVKVKGFLNELIQDKTMPKEVRVACAKLLDSFNAGVPLDEAMRSQTTSAIKELEENLKVEYGK